MNDRIAHRPGLAKPKHRRTSALELLETLNAIGCSLTKAPPPRRYCRHRTSAINPQGSHNERGTSGGHIRRQINHLLRYLENCPVALIHPNSPTVKASPVKRMTSAKHYAIKWLRAIASSIRPVCRERMKRMKGYLRPC